LPNEIVTSEHTRAIAKAEALKPTRDDLKHLPGYYERPAKVLRSGVGMVDGYEWGVTAKGQSREAAAIGEAMTPHWKASEEAYRNRTGQAYEPRKKPKGVRLMIATPDGRIWKRVNGNAQWTEA
jgi:hypothetical protein